MHRHIPAVLRAICVVLVVLAIVGSVLVGTALWPGPAPAESASADWVQGPDPGPYDLARLRLYAYLTDACGPAPSARSCEWAIRHQYERLASGAVVTGATTSETQNRAFVFATLHAALTGDDTAMRGILDYLRSVAMPHDGGDDPAARSSAAGAPDLPVLVHWLVDVDGGTRMGDTGTVVGPNTPYLAHEPHAGEVPPNPDPDRESHISADDFKYFSAPGADQWLVDGLEVAYAVHGDAAHRALASRMVASLRDGLTTADDFRPGLVDDFEDGFVERWWPYATDRAVLAIGADQPAADGTRAALAMTYTVPWSGVAGTGRDLGQDWRADEGIALRFLGDGGGNAIRLLLTDPLTPTVRVNQAAASEYFEHVITDTVAGWRTIEVPFTAFRERRDWPSDWATTGNGKLDLDRIETLAFEPLPGTFSDDFEHGDSSAWWTYAGEGASVERAAVVPGSGGGGRALWVTYTVAAGYAGIGASPNADWTGQTELAFDLQGESSGNAIAVGLVERGGERWQHTLRDDAAGWRAITIPLAAGDAGWVPADWQPDDASLNGRLDLGGISDLVFEPLADRFRLGFEAGDDGAWWTYHGDDSSTVDTAIIEPGAQGTTAALRLVFDIPPDGWAGAGVTVDGNWRAWDGLDLWLRGDGAVRVVIKDADNETYTYNIERPRPTWINYQPRWADFTGPVGRGGNRRLDLDHVRDLVIECLTEGETTVDVDEITVVGPALGAGRFALDNVRVAGGPLRTGAGVARVDEIERTGGPALPRYPNVAPYSRQWDQNGPLPWAGPLYTGHQDPAAYCLAGDATVPGDIVAFVRDAQVAYDAQVPGSANLGPFMPLFAQDPRYVTTGVPGWTWDGALADPNTGWGQYQYRTFAHMAQYFYLSGDPRAGEVLGRFERWLGAHTVTSTDGRVAGLPITWVPGSEDVMTGYRAGDFALAAQGLLYLAARTGAAPLRLRARALLDALVLHQDASGAFATDGVRYGYEQAEAGIALSLDDLLPGGDRPDPFLAALRGSGCQQFVRWSIYLPNARAK
jgi:hypothetical protein